MSWHFVQLFFMSPCKKLLRVYNRKQNRSAQCFGEEGDNLTVEELVEEYSNMLFKICLVIVGNEWDAQDVIQDVFCRYIEHAPTFRDSEHEKAWLIKVAVNRCRDIHRFRLRHPQAELEEISAYCELPEQSEVLLALMKLPEALKSVIYLHYIEGYKTTEITKLLGISLNAVKKRLERGRKALKLTLTD